MMPTGEKKGQERLSLRSFGFYWPVLVICIGIFFALKMADNDYRQSYVESLRSSINDMLSPIRARLEGNIKADIKLLQGVASIVETEPDMDQGRFGEIGRRIFSRPVSLLNLMVIRNDIVTMAFPLMHNNRMIGRSYRTSSVDDQAGSLALSTNSPVVTSPFTDAMGKQTLLIFYPMNLTSEQGRQTLLFSPTRPNGMVMATVDVERLLKDSGLTDLNLDIALYEQDQSGHTSPHLFYGDKALMQGSAVRVEVNLGPRNWIIAAAPKQGWPLSPPDIWAKRTLMFLLVLSVITPLLWAARLMQERQTHITELNQQKRDLRTISQRLQLALDASKIGVWEMDIGNTNLVWDSRMYHLYDVAAEKTIQTTTDWSEMLHPDDRDMAEMTLLDSLRNNNPYVTQFRILDRAGRVRHIRAFGTIYRDSHFRKKMVGVNWNVTADMELQDELKAAKTALEKRNRELEDARKAMEYTSLHDPLTELGNRRYLDLYLSGIADPQKTARAIALLHIDLDRFKEINDTLGHAAGDAMLRHTARQIRTAAGDGHFAARIGGDEFIVVLTGEDAATAVRDIAQAIITAINKPLVFEGQECRVGASIGIAMTMSGPGNAEQALINADIALYEAKRRGKNRVEFFNDTLKEATLLTKRTADAILRSLENQDFIAYFQPQFDARSLTVTGVEALARWMHPELGLLPPSAFLTVAESLNVMADIDDAVLQQALAEARRWKAHDLPIPNIAVNISAQRLFEDDLTDRLSLLDLPESGLSFELLESISFDDKGEAAAIAIDRVKALGIDIEIDDFGTGYSSILSLLKLSPRRLKIDRQLTLPILESPKQRRLIGSIVEIGRSLGIEIVAEGVETMQHAHILRDLGCHTLQGYALARPMSADDLFTLLMKNRMEAAQKIIA
ncbi:EAL domain-containing protein [Allorhizobium sp. BGMRC 0089]|uniref:bifunctional diguanylate cyclase/phosphodiesterase n=1 Tax=Allorhizobium sonneratiae TaxID=2934936 RepID=UPI0020339A44|nr:EAL domain-containing protein [Allorhizobium sonneratiae]MCM2291052.1 EAL domain-containing protein [Allorhizobium sonneratiae]